MLKLKDSFYFEVIKRYSRAYQINHIIERMLSSEIVIFYEEYIDTNTEIDVMFQFDLTLIGTYRGRSIYSISKNNLTNFKLSVDFEYSVYEV